MIIDAVREYLLSCPELSGKKININCLGTKPGSLTVDNVPADATLKKYCDGEELKQAVFVLGVRDRYDENLGVNAQVSELLEKVETWIYKQNLINNLPKISGKEIMAKGVEVTKSGHLYDTSISNGRWQLEFRLLYLQKA